ncbi:MAG: DNA methyltransferase, partial [Bacteroidota bacterium]
MEIHRINDVLAQLENDRANGRDHIITLAATLIEWMGFAYVENNRPRLLDFKTLKLKEALVPAPITGQEQIYRMTAEGQNLRVRFAVLKKFDKKVVQYLVDTNVGLGSYQAGMRGIKQIEGREPYVSSKPYFVHFITTAKYDRLWVVFTDEGEQKRILMFRNKLSQTQFHKILPVWQNIAAKPKPEMAKLFWNCLDVKEVNKDFYKQIKDQFDSLIGIAKAQKPDVDEAITKQFAVRLIGRYIFCWFLKEKEVIPEALVASGTIEKYKGMYFQTLLSKLFFNTLNAEVTDPSRYETITSLDELYKNIPYLNGGLFDWHPEDILFNQIDLNEWLIAFVKVLENFDFTVDESSSTYQHVAIDPEMLGCIFENLLASQNPDTEKMANQRKAFGAFYTPREIVDYMVNESLRASLESKLLPEMPKELNVANEPMAEYRGTLFQDAAPKQIPISYSDESTKADIERRRERWKTKLVKLFALDCTDNPFDSDETIQVRKALSQITVLDPACGSGAFPMGVMLRLMELRQIVGHGHRNSYDLKEEILSKNIFGVDIMPMAVEIARLRAWLSLVLESDYKPNDRKNNFGIAALPNLDFKFVCANSLIDSGYDDFLDKIHLNATLYRLDGEIQKLERMRNDYFDPKGDKEKKKELQTEFEYTKEYIKAQLNQGSLRKSYQLDDFFSKVDDWNPFDDSNPSSFFSP